jgi:hypothetical protein
MSREQYEWLERKGVQDVYLYEFKRQDDERVYLYRSDIGLSINRKKDVRGWKF